ncbi:MAG: SIMPL domain-containing protein [Candidatus Pacebacteria bacterium]|nr:SIMPL domain-containing protein [Candidatus Paceibacterota bacterium]
MAISNRGIVALGVILGIALVAVSYVISLTLYNIKASENIISVAGSSEQVIRSDVVKWRATISRTSGVDNLKQVSAQMQKDLQAVLLYMKANGVAENEITVGVMNTNTMYPYGNGYYAEKGDGSGQITGYSLAQDVTVQSSNVEVITKAAQGATALTNQGIVFSSGGLEYYYSKLADLKLQMLAKATEDAKQRAQKIAQSTGARVGALKSASMGVFQVTPVNSTELSDYGYYDTTSIDKQITAIVRTSFILK